MVKEEISLKSLSIIFFIGLILLIGIYFIFSNQNKGEDQNRGIMKTNILSSEPIFDEKRVVTNCSSLEGKILNDFGSSEGFEINTGGNTISQEIKKNGLCKDYLDINYIFDSKEESGYEFNLMFDNLIPWKIYTRFNFLIKCDEDLGSKNCLKLIEKDGDVWNYCGEDFSCIDNQWTLISINLKADEDLATHEGDGKHNWGEITYYWLVFGKSDQKKHKISLDNTYLT